MDPTKLKYTESHEWIGEKDGLFVQGITEFAQQQLGDVTYVELPEVGRALKAGDEAAVVESVKAASDIYASATGTVAAMNTALEENPELVNNDPYGEGWFFKLEGVDAVTLSHLMSAADYAKFCEDCGE